MKIFIFQKLFLKRKINIKSLKEKEMKIKIIMGFVALIGSAGAKADVLTDRVFETTIITSEQGQSQILPTFQYSESIFTTDDFNGNERTFKAPLQDYGFSYLYGVADNIALGGNIFWRHQNQDDDNKSGSFIDPELFIRAKNNVTPDLTLFYTGKVSVSPEKSKDDNNFSGGPSLKGEVGLRRYVNGPSAIVGFASFRALGDAKSEDDFGTDTSKGRHEIQVNAGYEQQIQASRVGLTIGGLKLLKGTFESSGGFSSDSPEVDYFVGNIYGQFQVSPDLKLIPTLRYIENIDGRDDSKIQIYSGSMSLGMVF